MCEPQTGRVMPHFYTQMRRASYRLRIRILYFPVKYTLWDDSHGESSPSELQWSLIYVVVLYLHCLCQYRCVTEEGTMCPPMFAARGSRGSYIAREPSCESYNLRCSVRVWLWREIC